MVDERKTKQQTTKNWFTLGSRENKSWYLKTSIRSSRNQAHIVSGLAQFTHPHGFLSQQTPRAVWSDEESDAGYAALARIRYVYDSKNLCGERRAPPLPRATPLKPSGLFRLLACITVPPNVSNGSLVAAPRTPTAGKHVRARAPPPPPPPWKFKTRITAWKGAASAEVSSGNGNIMRWNIKGWNALIPCSTRRCRGSEQCFFFNRAGDQTSSERQH